MMNYIISFLLLLTIVGCSKAISEEIPKNGPGKPNLNKVNEVKMVVIEESPEESTSPANAALKQYKFIFENNTEKFISKSEITNEVMIGNKGIVTLDTRKFNNNFVVMLYEKERKWNVSALIDIDLKHGHYFNDKGELALPFNNFVIAKYTDRDPKTWVFSSKEKVVSITKMTAYSFEDNNVKIIPTSDGKEIYVSEDPNNPYLYYFDSQHLIVIAGNISEKEMITLSKSIPPANSPSFPSK